jgi:dipeptidyl aminopeptidase/acylaminoacyl peptidase
MIGPYPEAADVYEERSPIHNVDGFSCPVVLLQGLEDRVVPTAQAEAIVEALDAKGIPHAYVAFEGEGHGFRKAENIERAREIEYYFYSRVFEFDPADDLDPVEIVHEQAL